MKLFSKIAFVFNLAFLFAVFMRFVEREEAEAASPLAAVQPLENTLIIMGYCAVLVNLAFLVSLGIARAGRRITGLPSWLWVFNLVMLILQFLYFFVLP